MTISFEPDDDYDFWLDDNRAIHCLRCYDTDVKLEDRQEWLDKVLPDKSPLQWYRCQHCLWWFTA